MFLLYDKGVYRQIKRIGADTLVMSNERGHSLLLVRVAPIFRAKLAIASVSLQT